MACELKSYQPFFIIEILSRYTKSVGYHDYIFVGEQNDDVMNSLSKIDKLDTKSKDSTKQDKSEYDILKTIFGIDNLNLWKKMKENKKKLYFVPCLIQMDDNLNEVKKKIFIYCKSFIVVDKGGKKILKEEFILPTNQELWIKVKNNKRGAEKSYDYKILGYHWVEKVSDEPYKYKPHLYEQFGDKYDTELFHEANYMINSSNMTEESHGNEFKRKKEYKVDTGDNYMLLFDIFKNDVSYEGNIIYVSNVIDEIYYLKDVAKKWKDSEKSKIINFYLKKYWPNLDINKNTKEIETDHKILLKIIERNQYINKMINTLIIDQSMFSCSIKTIKFNVNFDENDILMDDTDETELENFYKDDKDYVDLYQIFDYIRKKEWEIIYLL